MTHHCDVVQHLNIRQPKEKASAGHPTTAPPSLPSNHMTHGDSPAVAHRQKREIERERQ